MNQQYGPTLPRDRIEAIDAVRGAALFGILIVNLVTEFRVSIFEQFLAADGAVTGIDSLAEKVVAFGFAAKSFCLFALLFGIGLGIQFERLAARSRPDYLLARRLIVLLALGLVHLLLIWNGDILVEYALAGFLALPFLRLPARGLLAVSLAFLFLYAAGPGNLYSIAWPSAETLRQRVAVANQVYASGSLVEVWRLSLAELPLLLPLHLYALPRTVALFLFGAFVWKAGALKGNANLRRMTAVAIAGIAAGALLTIAEATGALSPLHKTGQALAALAPVALALGYGAALFSLAQAAPTRRLLSIFAPAGRMAFTNYVMQSLIFSCIFFGYGLGEFGRMGAAGAFALGIAVYAAQLVISRWWLACYRFGPLEWLWRSLMYGALQPMRISAAHRVTG